MNKYFFIFLGTLIFSVYMWLRFIRERLPKDIPIELSILGFFILIYICCIYAYIVISHIRTYTNLNDYLKVAIDTLYKPLEDLDYFWKHLPFIENHYKRVTIQLVYKLQPFIKNTNIFYIIFAILPRIILVAILFIDIFWFSKLYYIYKFLFLGIFIFLNRYIIYSLKMLKIDLIVEFKEDLDDVWTKYEFGIHPSEWPENYDPDDPDNDEYPDTMALPVEIFVKYYIDNLVYKNQLIDYHPTYNYHKSFFNKICKEFNLNRESEITTSIRKQFCEKTNVQLNTILNVAKVLEHYDIANTQNNVFKYLKILIFSSYFTCWLYILILSTSVEILIKISIFIMKIIAVEEPFSGLFL